MKRSLPVLMSLLACAETPSSESTHSQVATAIGGDLRSRLVGRSCDGVLLLAESPTCGNHPGWFAQRLFPAALTGSPALDRYCVYRWRGAGKPAPTDYPAAGMAVDCVASVGFITSDDAADLPPDAEVMEQRQEMERRFLAHAGALDSLPRPAFPAEGGVRISVLDTARDVIPGRPGRGRSDHGRVMGLIASRLACPLAPGSACLAGIDNVLTLNTLPTDDGLETDGSGGSLTYRSHVARSIVEAVAATPPGQRSIITMSLGWHFDAGRNGPATSPMPLPERVVLEALRYARCRGSLIFAATGNTDGARPPTPGPHYPGGWQQVAAPTRQQCLSELGVAAPHDPSGPLVHALTGVDAVDAPLYNTPVGAISPLAAPGAHAYVTDPAPVLPEGVAPVREKTGSSPAAAVAAGIAATAWAYWPDRSADEIMQLLRDAAIDLGLPADYCSGALPCGNVRRLSLCRLVAAAGVAGRTATPAPTCAAAPARSLPGQIPRLAAQPADGCASRLAAPGCVSNPRPLSVNDLLLPVAAPTPDETICPGCSAERVFVTEIARVAGAPPARRSLRLDLPINRVLSNYQIDLNGAWVRDDLGWRWLSLWNRGARGGRGGSKLDLTLDPDDEGITGPVQDVAVEFIYRYLGADADLDDQGRPASYTTTEPLFVR